VSIFTIGTALVVVATACYYGYLCLDARTRRREHRELIARLDSLCSRKDAA
jgi:hypothetical protein